MHNLCANKLFPPIPLTFNLPSLIIFLRSQSSLCPSAHPSGDPWSPDLPLHHPPNEERTHHPDTYFYVCLPGCCYAAGKHMRNEEKVCFSQSSLNILIWSFILKMIVTPKQKHFKLFKAALIHIFELIMDQMSMH